ncbi:hypothetical protein ACWC0C_41960 [Streptomyces sp. NPDC001709]
MSASQHLGWRAELQLVAELVRAALAYCVECLPGPLLWRLLDVMGYVAQLAPGP